MKNDKLTEKLPQPSYKTKNSDRPIMSRDNQDTGLKKVKTDMSNEVQNSKTNSDC
jgi:hypothetical protein